MTSRQTLAAFRPQDISGPLVMTRTGTTGLRPGPALTRAR